MYKKSNLSRVICAAISACVLAFTSFCLGSIVTMPHVNHLREYAPKEVLATIDGENILGKDLQKHLDIYTIGMPISEREKLTNRDIDLIESESLNSIISSKALSNTVNKDKKVKITEKELNSHYDNVLKNMLDSANMSKKDFFRYYNLDEETLKKLFEEDLLVSKYLAEKSNFSSEELEDYYNKNKSKYKEIKVSKILIKDITDSGKKKASEIIDEFKNGKSFEELYNKYDDTKSTTNTNGGDLGYQSRADLQDELRNSLFSEDLKVGEIYPTPIKTNSGYFIIKKTGEKKHTLNELKNTLESDLKYEKQKREISNSLKKAKIDMKIKLNVPIKEIS